MASTSTSDPGLTSFLDRYPEPRVCLLTSSSDINYRCHLEDFEFDAEMPFRDLMPFFADYKDFEGPSPLQSFAWSSLFFSSPTKSLIIQVQNSRPEKLLTYVLPLVVLVNPAVEVTQAICVVCNYQVGKQVLDLVKKLGKNEHIKSCLLSELDGFDSQKQLLKLHQVVIGTAFDILQMFRDNYLDYRTINIIVFSDIDQILRPGRIGNNAFSGGFGNPRYVMEYARQDCQVLLVSSTINDDVKNFSEMIKAERPYNWIFGNPEELGMFCAKQYKILLDPHEETKGAFIKKSFLCSVNHQVVIFVKQGREWLMKSSIIRINDDDTGFFYRVEVYDGSERSHQCFERFKRGWAQILITSQSLDWRVEHLKEVSLVINADLPTKPMEGRPPSYWLGFVDYQEWLLRSSLAGRLGRSGLVLNLIQGDEEMQDMRRLERYFERQIPELQLPSQIPEVLQEYFYELKSKHGIEYGHRHSKHGKDDHNYNS